MDNLFTNIPANLPEELIETLAEKNGVRIERIVSRGHCSDPEFWYDQDEFEWVIVLQGSANLEFKDSRKNVHLTEGDYLLIKPHEKHRVSFTSSDIDTIWLAIFW